MNPEPPIGLNWLPTVDRNPAETDLELASAFTVPIGYLATLGAADDGDLGVWWRLDAALASRPRHPADQLPEGDDRRQIHPAVLMRPCTEFVVDKVALEAAYLGWKQGLVAQRRLDLKTLREDIPDLDKLVVPRPAGFPIRRAAALESDQGAYRAHTVAALRAGHLASRSGGVSDPARVWLDLPWVAEHALRPPPANGELVFEDCDRLRVIEQLGPEEARGRARSHALPSLAGALYEKLPGWRTGERTHGLGLEELYSGGVPAIAPLASRFAYEVCQAAGPETPWLERALEDYGPTVSTRDAATRGLAEKVRKQVKRLLGRGEKARTLVRRIKPFLVADTGVWARPLPADRAAGQRRRIPKDEAEQVAELLLEWLRADTCLETLDLVAAGNRDALRFRCPGGTWADYDRARWGALHLGHVVVPPGEAGLRSAAAAMPGAALGAPVDTWVCGFGEHFDQVWERELGARVGEALPGVSFSPSPSPSIRFGG